MRSHLSSLGHRYWKTGIMGQVKRPLRFGTVASDVASPPSLEGFRPALASSPDLHGSILPVQQGFEPTVAASALKTHGYVLVKHGCQEGITAAAFSKMAMTTWTTAGYDYVLGDYEGGTVQRAGTSLEDGGQAYDVKAGAPNDKPVLPHCENAYLAYMPHFAAFACKRPADVGGELILTDVQSVMEHLGPNFLEKCSRLGINYIRRMGHHGDAKWTYATGTWQDRLGTDDWVEAQQLVAQDPVFGATTGGSASLNWYEGFAELSWRMSGFAKTPTSQAVSAHEQAEHASPNLVMSILDNHALVSMYGEEGDVPALHCTWGDGNELTLSEITAISDAYTAAKQVRIRMEEGDVIIADNFRFAHSREPYSGPREHMAVFSEKVWRGIEVPNPLV